MDPLDIKHGTYIPYRVAAGRVAEPWHFGAAPAPELVKIFTAPAPTLLFGVHLILHGTFFVQQAEFFPVLKTVLWVHNTDFMISFV